MNNTEHLTLIQKYFPKTDLISVDEFSLFDNEDFALKTFEYISGAIDNINSKFEFQTHFSFRFNINFNAKAWTFKDVNIIMLNHSIINDLESIIKDSISIFFKENFTKASDFPIEEDILLELFIYLTMSYLFFHELGHIIQFNSTPKGENCSEFNESSHYESPYLEKNHVYEIDADLFGVSVGSILILQYLEENKIKLNLSILFNLVTLYALIISNIFIEFANKFERIYFKESTYPHPIIRTRFCIEQILNIVQENITIDEEYFNMIENRYLLLLNEMRKHKDTEFDYLSLLKENEENIIKYMDEIEKISDNYRELTRHKAQEIYDLIGI